MDHGLLDILACPYCKSELVYKAREKLLICRADRYAFPIRNDKPIMLISEAQTLSSEEMAKLIAS